MNHVTRETILGRLDYERQKFLAIKERLDNDNEMDDIDRLMDSTEHWEALIDYTNEIRLLVSRLNKA